MLVEGGSKRGDSRSRTRSKFLCGEENTHAASQDPNPARLTVSCTVRSGFFSAFFFFSKFRPWIQQLKRLFQQYLGGGSWGGSAGAMVDRFVSPSGLRVVDYVAVMTVKLAPQLKADCDEMSDLKQVRGRQRELGVWLSVE